MAVARIERIWDGTEYPLLAWDGASYVNVGFSRVGWQRPMSVLAPLLAAQIAAATGATVAITVADDGKLGLVASAPITLAMGAGFAVFVGWAATQTGVTEIVGGTQTYALAALYSVDLPALVWHRQVTGRHAVVWDGPFRVFAVRNVSHYRATPAFDWRRVPVVLWRGDDTAWSVANPDGFLPLRPLDSQGQQDWLNRRSGDYSETVARCLLLEGTHA